MKKVLLLTLLTIMLVGCTSEQATTTFSKTFIGGTEAIHFEFLEDAPPAEVYDGGAFPFEVTLNVENKGEYDVPRDKIDIELVGFFPGDFDNPTVTKTPDEDLDKSYIEAEGNEIPGTVTYVTFDGFNFKTSLNANNEYTMRANVCYVYGTRAQADMCILDDLTESDDDTVCQVSEGKTIYSSSAPIQIENFEQSIAGTDKITFSFEIVHRGSGAIARRSSDCDDETINKNKVWIEVDNGLSGLECAGLTDGTATTGFTTLFGGKRLIRCTQDTSAPDLQKDFEKKVNILAEYDYKEHKDTQVLVKHTT